jgi:hypothetical protein
VNAQGASVQAQTAGRREGQRAAGD